MSELNLTCCKCDQSVNLVGSFDSNNRAAHSLGWRLWMPRGTTVPKYLCPKHAAQREMAALKRLQEKRV